MSKILLVEPDHVLASTYVKALESEGHKVSLATGAQSAVALADANKPDLVVLELQLIEHSGIEFLYELRSYPDWQDIPVIIQTQVPPAEFSGSWELLKNELKINEYLYKPRSSLKRLVGSVRQLNLDIA